MSCNKFLHFSSSNRLIIESGIYNGSTKSAIASTLGKNKSTIGKEIKLHRLKFYSSNYSIDCSLFSKCKDRGSFSCNLLCPSYSQFTCYRRDCSSGACNGCDKYPHCRYDKFKHSASIADHDVS